MAKTGMWQGLLSVILIANNSYCKYRPADEVFNLNSSCYLSKFLSSSDSATRKCSGRATRDLVSSTYCWPSVDCSHEIKKKKHKMSFLRLLTKISTLDNCPYTDRLIFSLYIVIILCSRFYCNLTLFLLLFTHAVSVIKAWKILMLSLWLKFSHIV